MIESVQANKPTMADLMRARTSSDPHIFVDGYTLGSCHRCSRRRGDPLHWSREDDKAEMKRRWDRMKAEWAA